VLCRWLGLNDRKAITELDGDSDNVTVSGESLARELFESLHRIHEFQLVVGVLLLVCRGVDAAPPLGFRSSFGRDLTVFAVSARRLAILPAASIVSSSAIVDERIDGQGGKIEFVRALIRLYIVVGHEFGSQIGCPREGNVDLRGLRVSRFGLCGFMSPRHYVVARHRASASVCLQRPSRVCDTMKN